MNENKSLIRSLKGEPLKNPPCWLMRQAGRYLPEYKALRGQANGFMDFCFSPKLARDATLQPLARFDLDAAIIFSDILVIPHALGQQVWFEEGVGPQLGDLKLADLTAEGLTGRLGPVYEAIELVRSELPSGVALIGFAGAPWTVASYMIEGGTSRTFDRAKMFALQHPEAFQELLDLLVRAVGDHIIAQARAGAEVIQLFDSWAGVVPEALCDSWIMQPTARIVQRIKQEYPDVPVIGFPKGLRNYEKYVQVTGVDGISLDQTVSLQYAAERLQPEVTVQGALDPHILAVGGNLMDREVERQLKILNNGPYIFNLGHGVIPQTPPENVARLVEIVKR